MASQLLRTGVLVLCKMLVQIRQHFQAAVNEVYPIHHMFNALLAANPVGIQRPEGLLLIVVGSMVQRSLYSFKVSELLAY